MAKVSTMKSPWDRPPTGLYLGVMASRVFSGKISGDDLQFMATAILQMCDDLAVLRKQVEDQRARIDHLEGK